MKTNIKRVSFVLFAILPLVFGACKYDLVKETTFDYSEKKNAADYDDFILPPQSVVASHGQSKAITLEWIPVKNAVQYQIYSAPTPYDTFTKVSETKGDETQIIIDEESGITKYYCVCAVNYYGTVSAKSVVVMGTSLAVPVITSIEPSEEGNSVTVNWWMDNCSASTYEKSVLFNVYAYALSAPSIKLKSMTLEGHNRQAVVDGLASKTEYFFEVEVVNSENDSKETSGKTTAETAHRVVPDAPENFSVSQGESSDGVELSWTLPEKAWYRENAGASGFVLHKLYFTVYRKLYGHSDSEYTAVYTVHKESASDPEEYIPGKLTSWTDTTAERGKKYTYYVQSFTDDLPEGKIITSQTSKTAQMDGWRLAVPQFSIKSEYTKSQAQTEFIQINFGFNLLFETYGKSYTYIVKRTQYDIEHSEEVVNVTQPQWIFTMGSDLNTAKDEFDSPATQKGYYTYTVYICPFGSNDNTDSALASVTASGKYIVTNDVAAIPVINGFTLKDGFSNHFKLSWEYNSKYRYIIHWTDIVNGIRQNPQSYEIPEAWFAGKSDGATVVYDHTANSGDTRIYMLEASLGLSESFRPNEDTDDVEYQTLGTAALAIDSYEYDKLCISWPAVQKAGETYTVSAKYEGTEDELVADNISIEKQGSEDAPVYKCLISKPAGYNDASKSGKNIKLTVTAKSADTQITEDNETHSVIDVCTVGPALTKLSVGERKDNRIEISWKPVTGAKGYLIRRIAYTTADQDPQTITSGDCIDYPDIYYCEGTTVTKDGESISSDICQVSFSDGKYTLTDKNSDNASGNQNKIIWGIPFGYTVIPVKQDGGWQDFQPNGKTFSFGNNYESTYNQAEGTVPEVYNATKGYGLALHAKKSESGDKQEIVWNAPYNSQSVSPVYYYRDSESTSNIWHKINEDSVTLSQDQQGKWHALFAPDSKTSAYEYFVAYNMNSSELVDRVSPSFMNDTVVGLSAIDADYDFGSFPQEKSNKGYLLYIAKNSYNAQTGDREDFSEIATWSAWDHSYRSIGPSTAYVCIKNYNISTEWQRVAQLDSSLYFTGDPNGDQDNTAVSQPDANNKTRIKIAPKQLMAGTVASPITQGPLQVLRDAKHYYALELVNGATSVRIDNGVYAYRDVSELEFAKMVMLVFADGVDRIGNLNFEDKTVNGSDTGYKENKGSGSISFTHNGGWTHWGTEYNYELDNYAPKIGTVVANQYDSIIKINCTPKSAVCNRNLPGSGSYPKSFNSVTITSTKIDDKMPDTYNGSITFEMDGDGNAKINGEPYTGNSRKIFVPCRIYSDSNTYFNSKAYGWWPE